MLQPNTITTAIGILTAIIAIIALITEGQRNRITRQTGLLLNLNEQWCSYETKTLRRRVANNLLKKRLPNYELGELLDFFSMICFLYNTKSFETDMLSNQFSWWIIRYWLNAKGWVQNVRSIDPEGWKSIELVVKKLINEMEKAGEPVPSDKELKYFLKVEAGLFTTKSR